MRIFLIAAATAVALALGAHLFLDSVQVSAAQANATEATRLDRQESVNFYGRSA